MNEGDEHDLAETKDSAVSKNRFRLWTKRLLLRSTLFFYYCLPCLLALTFVLVSNFLRVRTVADTVEAQVCNQSQPQASPDPTKSSTPEELKEIASVVNQNGWNDCDKLSRTTQNNLTGRQVIRKTFFTAWFWNAVFITILSILPFGFMGLGLARKCNTQNEYGEYTKIAFRDFFLKYLVGFIIAVGFLYVFNPKGQAASALVDWVKNANVISKNTAPIFFDLRDSTIKHPIVAVLGWYLYLLGYFTYRFYNSDVLSTRIYNVLFKKFLFVIGVALIISSVGAASVESLILIFLIGMFPLSAVALLTEFGNKRLSMGEDQTSLSIIPGISTWQILRLEEEGIDSVSSLATSDPDALKQVISSNVISPGTLDLWIDEACLMTALGSKRWLDINGICETASTFLAKASDSEFKAKLAEKGIFNADELSTKLQRIQSKKPRA